MLLLCDFLPNYLVGQDVEEKTNFTLLLTVVKEPISNHLCPFWFRLYKGYCILGNITDGFLLWLHLALRITGNHPLIVNRISAIQFQANSSPLRFCSMATRDRMLI